MIVIRKLFRPSFNKRPTQGLLKVRALASKNQAMSWQLDVAEANCYVRMILSIEQSCFKLATSLADRSGALLRDPLDEICSKLR